MKKPVSGLCRSFLCYSPLYHEITGVIQELNESIQKYLSQERRRKGRRTLLSQGLLSYSWWAPCALASWPFSFRVQYHGKNSRFVTSNFQGLLADLWMSAIAILFPGGQYEPCMYHRTFSIPYALILYCSWSNSCGTRILHKPVQLFSSYRHLLIACLFPYKL